MNTTFPRPEIKVLADARALAEFATGQLFQIASDAIAARGRFCIALAGGSTPRLLYTLIAQPPWASEIDWRKVQAFWGDERSVPPDHPDSNYLMARQALLDHAPIPDANIHRIFGELKPESAALSYEDNLRVVFPGEQVPRFDLILLGLGEDGHTASLFPGSHALLETERWVVSVPHKVPPPPLVTRISLTLPVLNAAADVLFLVSGAGKAAILSRVMQNLDQSNPLPAQLVRPRDGRLVWAVDRPAAEEFLNRIIE